MTCDVSMAPWRARRVADDWECAVSDSPPKTNVIANTTVALRMRLITSPLCADHPASVQSHTSDRDGRIVRDRTLSVGSNGAPFDFPAIGSLCVETRVRPFGGKATHVLSLTLALSFLGRPVVSTVGPVIRRGIWLAVRGVRVRLGASPPARARVRPRERDRFRRRAARFPRAQESRFRWTRAWQRVLCSAASLPFSLLPSVARSPLLGGFARGLFIRLTGRLTTSKPERANQPAPLAHQLFYPQH